MADSDDWRVTISVSPAPAGQSSSLRQAEEDIRRQVGRGIGVGAGEEQIFLYASTEAAAGDAGRIARDVLARHGLAAESEDPAWEALVLNNLGRFSCLYLSSSHQPFYTWHQSFFFHPASALDEFVNYKAHCYANHRAFFILFSCFTQVGVADSLLKGIPHFLELGPQYFISGTIFFAGLVTPAITRHE